MRTMVRLGAAMIVVLVLGACGKGNVFSLEIGQCFADPGAGEEISDVATVDCNESHDFEVYALIDVPEGDFPGDASIEEAAIQGCFLRFDDYAGRDYETSALGYSWLVPTSASWDGGDREIICTLYEFEGGTLTGSMKDSGV